MRKSVILLLALILCITSLASCTTDTPSDIISQTEPEVELIPTMLPAEEVKVISMNLLVGDLTGLSGNLYGRDEIMPSLLLSYDADSIGVQETFGWIDILDLELIGYAKAGYCGTGRRQHESWYTADYIYYKEEKYNLLADGIYWLTNTPDIITVEAPNCTWAILQNKETGFTYVHINTHLTSSNPPVNAQEMDIIREIMAQFIKLGFPVFTTGDFNASQGGSNYRIMLEEELLQDAMLVADEFMKMGTYHGMNLRDLSGGAPIDFCFVSHQIMDVYKHEVIDTYVDGRFASDHNGIFVHANVHSVANPYELVPNIANDGIAVREDSVRAYVADFVLTQPKNISLIDHYRIVATDSNGVEVCVRDIPSHHFNKYAPDELNITLQGLLPGTNYTVTVTPCSVIDTRGESFEFTFTTTELE